MLSWADLREGNRGAQKEAVYQEVPGRPSAREGSLDRGSKYSYKDLEARKSMSFSENTEYVP